MEAARRVDVNVVLATGQRQLNASTDTRGIGHA